MPTIRLFVTGTPKPLKEQGKQLHYTRTLQVAAANDKHHKGRVPGHTSNGILEITANCAAGFLLLPREVPNF